MSLFASRTRLSTRNVTLRATLCAALITGSCAAPAGEAFAPVAISSIRITPSSASVITGQSVSLQAVALDAAGNQLPGRTISWSSSATTVATVSQAGTVLAVSPGVTTISATSEGRTGFADITVTKVPVASVSVQPAALTLEVQQSILLTTLAKDANGAPLTDRQVTYVSDNNAVATVDATGRVTGIGNGNASILATVEGKTATALVSVRPPVPVVTTVGVVPAQLALTVGQSSTLTTKVQDAGGNLITDRSPQWVTSNPAVATITSAGVVMAVAAGTARLTATVDGKSGSADVTITQAAQTVASITMSPTNLTIIPTGFGQLTATPLDEQGRTVGGATITWSSSAPSVATVSATGLVTGVSNGSAIITATSSGKSATAAVTVASSSGSGTLSRIDIAGGYGAFVVGDTGKFAFLPLASDGKTVVIPTGGFSTTGLATGPTQCSTNGCYQSFTIKNLSDGQPPQTATMTVFPTNGPINGPPVGYFRAVVISNVLDSLVLLGPNFVAGQRYTPPSVSIGSSIGLYPYTFYGNGGYTQAINAEYSLLAGSADLTRCTYTLASLTQQANCMNVTPRAAGTVTVQARLRKSDGSYWTSSLTFTAR